MRADVYEVEVDSWLQLNIYLLEKNEIILMGFFCSPLSDGSINFTFMLPTGHFHGFSFDVAERFFISLRPIRLIIGFPPRSTRT